MRSMSTLIIEDDEKIARIQQAFVEKIPQFSVVGIAHSVAEGGEMIDILQPELVLLDVFFPDGSGIDLLRRIRGNRHQTDVILITAAKEKEILQEAIRGGVFDYILKPLVFNRFSAALLRYLEYRQTLDTIDTIKQEDVDLFIRQDLRPIQQSHDLPKGVDAITLQKVIEVINETGEQGLSAEAAGNLLGVSRTTSRRYLEYLVTTGLVQADHFYGTPGRPERIYRRTGQKKPASP